MRVFAALGALLLAAPVHAHQAPATAYDEAVAARLRGDPAAAVRLLEPIVTAEPGNADAQVQLGYSLLALERLDEAEDAFRAALSAAPDYSDARLGLARIAQRRGDRQGALRELQPLDPANSDVRTLQSQLGEAEAAFPWSLDLDGSYSVLDRPQSDWAEGAVQLRRRFSERTAAWGRIEVSRRFDRTDTYFEAGVDQAVGDRARLYLAFGGTPNADFRPRYQVSAGGSLRLSEGAAATILTLDARHSEFELGDVQTLTPGVEQYVFGGRAWLTARWINLFDERGKHRSGYLLRGDLQARDRARIFAGYSDAPDTSEGIVVETRSYFGGLSLDLTERTTARLSLAHEDRETGADRTQFGLGLGWRF